MDPPNPLNMPEIITLIGHCLPLWKYSERLGFYDYTPKTLLSCTAVNSTWRDALLPVIWYVYSGFVMRSIPKEVIIKNSRFFRVFFYDRSFSGPFECIHLRALNISWWNRELLPLVEANAGALENLVLKGSTSPSPMRAMTLPSLDYDLFMRMTSTLEELQLSHWTLSGRQFVKFLRACKRLSHLVFVAIEWTDPALVDPQYHLQAVQGLTDLQLDISVSKKDAFVDLIRSCPDLKRFSLYSESADDARTLIPVLRESCPKLMAIEYVARFSSALNGYDLLSDTEYSDLVLCSGRIESLKVDIPCLDNAMTKALITQSSTLTSLTLSFISLRSVPMIDAENICLILRHCIRLRNLSLLFNPHSLGKNETLRIFDQPWSCVELETLELTDVSMAMEHGSPSNDPQPPPLQLQPYQWRLGSAPQLIPIDGNRVIRYGSMTKQKLFQQVRMLPKLTRLSLNHITYSVDGFGSSSG